MYKVYVRYDMKPGAREGFLEKLADMGLRKAVLPRRAAWDTTITGRWTTRMC